MIDKKTIHKVLSSLWKNDDNIEKICYNKALQDAQTAFDFIPEEPVGSSIKKEALWHSLDEKPVFPKSWNESLCTILVLYDNGNVFLYRYGPNGHPNSTINPHFRDIEKARWCYCNDLIP